ncbi:MAG TPA: MATE family efflux transporter [Candidatus Pullilachnospira stercoravium]|uniref:Probable multidrug resistance protein NorM n=1 Tax=Candidatus Pullilachnospira stercoravium TaxID=2840913 RepID=A0A9D1T5N6_9FIRM|nr:MATE family efflux transporter [Candidatus Pullilachnospira stercoravium]
MAKSYEMDMTSGPLLKKILIFSVPLMLSGILQLLFNAADIIVVGQFTGSSALAAVGSTSSLINLFVNVFIGFSIGANVLVAQYFGARDEKNVHETVHTSILLAIICGLILIVAGISLAPPMLELMDTPDEVLGQAVLYMRIYFVGMPATLVYNFGAAILRAVGDTRRPLYYLFVAGCVNVVLNLFFVVVCGRGVDGVAIATVISQVISAALIVRCLVKSDGMYRLNLSMLKLHRQKVIQIARIGLPAGFQGAIFSISNVLIQSSVNSFGSIAMAGNTAASNIEGFIYTCMNAVYQTSLSFTSQNLGAGKIKRISRILVECLVVVFLVGAVMGFLAYTFGAELLRIYSTDPEVIENGLHRMRVICQTYYLCGMMDVTVGALRGLGYSVMPMLVSLAGVCGVRIVWIFTAFVWSRSLFTLYISYPISWGATFVIHLICFAVVYRKLKARRGAQA